MVPDLVVGGGVDIVEILWEHLGRSCSTESLSRKFSSYPPLQSPTHSIIPPTTTTSICSTRTSLPPLRQKPHAPSLTFKLPHSFQIPQLNHIPHHDLQPITSFDSQKVFSSRPHTILQLQLCQLCQLGSARILPKLHLTRGLSQPKETGSGSA